MALKDPNSKPEDRRPYGKGKNKQIKIAVTDEVNELIRKNAKKLNMTITDYIVGLVINDREDRR